LVEYDQEDEFDSEDVFGPPAVQVEAEFSTDGVFQRASLINIEEQDEKDYDSSIIEQGGDENNPFVTDSSLLLPESTGHSLVLDDTSLDLRGAVSQSLDLDQDGEEKEDVFRVDAFFSSGNHAGEGVSMEISLADKVESMTPRNNPPLDINGELFDASREIKREVEQKSLAAEMYESLSFDADDAPAAEEADDEAEAEYVFLSYFIDLTKIPKTRSTLPLLQI
jgi:hypothetical protein